MFRHSKKVKDHWSNEIFDLITAGENERSKQFRENIRQYNSVISFVPFGSQITY